MTEKAELKTGLAKQLPNIIIGAVIVLTVLAYIGIFMGVAKPSSTQTQAQSTALRAGSKTYDISKRKVIRVLFIGNSHTFYNDMPKTFKELAAHDPDGAFSIESGMIAVPGATLAQLLKYPEAQTLLTQQKWDYVVLQPQSAWAMTKIRTMSTDQALKEWVRRINGIGAVPVFYMTWIRQPGSDWYTSSMKGADMFKSPQIMYKYIQYYTNVLVKKHDLVLVPVGEYWMNMIRKHPEVTVFAPDGLHASPAGSYMVALLFYKMLVNNTLDDITYYPTYMTPEEQETIIQTVSSKLPPMH